MSCHYKLKRMTIAYKKKPVCLKCLKDPYVRCLDSKISGPRLYWIQNTCAHFPKKSTSFECKDKNTTTTTTTPTTTTTHVNHNLQKPATHSCCVIC